ncbi:MAG: ACT domain-containing protein [Deltaproteobacteria bacterium]|nr:ACT domain-containing protein [Deltaproteobacteria bacterium]
MQVQQIAIFLENRSGRLADISALLARENINIRAMSLADTADFGILRLVVDDTEKAKTALKDNGFTTGITDIIAVQVADQPGGLDSILQVVKKARLDVEYMYAFTQKSGELGILLFRFDDLEAAIKALRLGGVKILPGEEVHGL